MSILRKLAGFKDDFKQTEQKIKYQKNKTSFNSILLIAICVALFFTIKYYFFLEKNNKNIPISVNTVINKTQIENVNNDPLGMLGATWLITQAEVKNLYENCYQFKTDILACETKLYNRLVKVTYHFQDNQLVQISAFFQDEFKTPKEMSDVFYETQKKLSFDYGEMSNPVMHEIKPQKNGNWENQTFLESEKKWANRSVLVHRIIIQDNGAGEQIYMFLSK